MGIDSSQPPVAFNRVAEMLLTAVVLTVLATVLLGLIQAGWRTGARWTRHRRSSLAPGESTFVGRLGRVGPELFVVGAGVRRLPLLHERKPGAWWRDACQLRAALAATILAETVGRGPSSDLVRAFAEERLAHVPVDGFVLETEEVRAWLDARDAATSKPASSSPEQVTP